MRLELLTELNRLRAARKAGVLVTDLGDNAQRLVAPEAFAGDPLGPELAAALRMGKSGPLEKDGRSYFLTVQAPSLRFVIIGAVHVSQALAPMAALCGYDVTIIDPRTAFASPERFPDVRVLAHWPDDAIAKLGGFDRYTAVAAVTHDPKIDDPALTQALRSDCVYVGALGSRKTHARRVERLTAAGFSPEQIGRIRAPIGLDIGAVSPAEIATSILAEVIDALRRKPARAEAAA
ncbi:MAG: XdhC family protein [Rhizobiales bacterium]|nr:XdhC family protein [Hyphomicrobiales bacterium]